MRWSGNLDLDGLFVAPTAPPRRPTGKPASPSEALDRQRAAAARAARASVEARRARAERGLPAFPGHPSMTDRPYADDEAEFLRAMDAYQQRTGSRFPSWTEALAVLKSLGWRKA